MTPSPSQNPYAAPVATDKPRPAGVSVARAALYAFRTGCLSLVAAAFFVIVSILLDERPLHHMLIVRLKNHVPLLFVVSLYGSCGSFATHLTSPRSDFVQNLIWIPLLAVFPTLTLGYVGLNVPKGKLINGPPMYTSGIIMFLVPAAAATGIVCAIRSRLAGVSFEDADEAVQMDR